MNKLLRNFIPVLSLFALPGWALGQCDTSTIYNNTTSNAVCFDTTYSKVRNCYTNNYPDHSDSYNSPFTLEASNAEYSMCLYPDTNSSFTPLYETTETTVGCTYVYTFGVGINGVKYDPSSAEYFVDTAGENNISWHKEARYMFSANFGNNGGHLNPFGEYHYHDVPADYFANDLGIDGSEHSPIVGWAADGFPMYYKYVFSDANDTSSAVISLSSGYSLKSGSRPGDGITAPDGSYSGLYYEDYEYSSTTLDECNGRWGKTPDFPDGTYYYVLTDNYPYIPRCFKGTAVDNTFRVGPGASCPSSTASTDCSEAPVAVSGCMDPFSCNYNPSATVDDGSCDYSYNHQDLTVTQSNSYTAPSGAVLNATGIHYDTVTVMGDCDTIYTIDLTITTSCGATITSTNPTSCGGTNGSIEFNMPTGTPPFDFSIDNGVSYTGGMPPVTFSNLSAGTYYCVVKDNTGCTSYTNVELSEPSTITFSSSSTNANCGASDGSITITASGSSGYTYSNDGGASFQPSNVFSNIASGNYSIVVKDGSGCTASGSASVANSSTLAIDSVSASDPSCEGSSDGSLTIHASGGSGTLMYSIDSGMTLSPSNMFTGLTGGSYSILVGDTTGCAVTESGSLSEPVELDPEITAWILGDGSTGRYWDTTSGTIITTTHFANVKSVSYTEDYVFVNASGIPDYIYGPFPDGNPSMPGDADYLFQIPRNPVEQTGTKTQPGTGQIGVFINGVPIYNYSDDMSYNNMGIWNQNAVVMENDGFDAQKGHPSPNMSDLNSSYYHHHQSPTTFNSALANVVNNIGDTYPSTGLYDIDSTVHSPLIGFAFDGYPVYGAYGYDNADGTGGIVRIQSGYRERSITTRTTLPDGTSLSPSQYGPNVSATYPIGSYKEDFEFDSTYGHLDEYNGRWCVTPEFPEGTYAYFATVDEDWNSAYPYIVGDGYFGVVISDNFPSGTGGNGTVVYDNSAIAWDGTVYDGLNFSATISDASCGSSDGSIVLSADGGNGPAYLYALNGGSLQSSGSFTGLAAGEYQVTVQDAGGCDLTDTLTISNPGAPVIDTIVEATPTCNGDADGILAISASGGTGSITYSIDSGATYSANTLYPGLNAGTYNVFIKDNNNCVASKIVSLSEPDALAYSAFEQDPTCVGEMNGYITLTLTSGGNGTILYSIDNGTSTQTTNTFTGLTSDTYDVVIKDDDNCSVSGTITLTDPAPLSLSTTAADPSCGANDGSLSASGSGGTGALTYALDGGTAQSSGSFTGLGTGTYIVTLKDAYNCTLDDTTTLSNASGPSINTSSGTDPLCNGDMTGQVVVTASGGTGLLDYSIDGGSTTQASGTFNGLASGTYTVEVTDQNNCLASVMVNLNGPDAISATAVSTEISCNGDSDASITVNASGGTGSLEYSIDNGNSYQDSSAFVNLGSATYEISVRDSNGCTISVSTIAISEPDPIVLSATISDVSTFAGNDGAIDLTVSGGNSGYTFDWDNDGTGDNDDTEDLSGLEAGNYSVTVSDAKNCSSDSMFIVLDGVIGIAELITDQLLVFPNPAARSITIQADIPGIFHYEVFNGIGQKVLNGSSEGPVDLSELAPGTYQLLIHIRDQHYMTRIVKQ